MLQKNVNDLLVFLTIAKERSFTKAASKLGVSQSALSHTMRNLEKKLDVKLLSRTTRSVAPTKLGEMLLKSIAPRLEEIVEELGKVTDLKKRPFGHVRLLTDEHAANFVVWPLLRNFLRQYPDIKFDVEVTSNFQEDLQSNYDARINIGEVAHADLLSFPISDDMQIAVVASPLYLQGRTVPKIPYDLLNHQCINYPLSFMKSKHDWLFTINKRQVTVHTEGQFVCNTLTQAIQAALDGFGFAYIPIKEVQHVIQKRHLVRVLSEYSPIFPGYYLQYPNRRYYTQAFSLFLKSFKQNITEKE